jgi:hypothetical protein
MVLWNSRGPPGLEGAPLQRQRKSNIQKSWIVVVMVVVVAGVTLELCPL